MLKLLCFSIHIWTHTHICTPSDLKIVHSTFPKPYKARLKGIFYGLLVFVFLYFAKICPCFMLINLVHLFSCVQSFRVFLFRNSTNDGGEEKFPVRDRDSDAIGAFEELSRKAEIAWRNGVP